MKITARDQYQQNVLANAFHERERFTLTGAGFQAEFVAETLNRVPCIFGSGRYETNLELVQVTEAITKAAWNGEGLPPVGTVCEAQHGADWLECEILAHHQGLAICAVKVNDAGATHYEPNAIGDLRPIRTPEQIAAEKREADIEELRVLLSNVACDDYQAAAAMIDAGYHK